MDPLEVGERKLRAARAIQTENHEDLWLMTLAFLQFKGRKGTGISQHTLRAYRRGLFDHLIYIGGADILRVFPEEAQTYVRTLEQGGDKIKPESPATVQLQGVAARRFYGALQRCGFALENPFDKVMIRPDLVKPHEKRSEYGLGTVKELVHACDTFDDPVSKVAILLAVLSGLRVEEIARLEWGDIDFRERLIRVQGKGKKVRTVPLDTAIGKALSKVPHTGKEVLTRYYHKSWAAYTTAGLGARIRQLCLKAFGVNPFSQQPNGYKGVHAFRHTFGVVMQEQVGALETQALLGHDSLTITMRYSKVTSRKAHEQLFRCRRASNSNTRSRARLKTNLAVGADSVRQSLLEKRLVEGSLVVVWERPPSHAASKLGTQLGYGRDLSVGGQPRVDSPPCGCAWVRRASVSSVRTTAP